MWISASSRSFRHISTDFISRILTNSVQSAGLRVKPTLFTVTVPPVHSASVVPEKAPGSDPAVRVATVIVLSYSFARVALLEAGHFGPVHAPGAGLGDVYRSTVEPVFPAALDAVSERQDEWGDAAGITEPAIRGQKCGCESKKDQIHVRGLTVDSRKTVALIVSWGDFESASSPGRGTSGRNEKGKTMRINETPNGQAAPRRKSNNVLVVQLSLHSLYATI